MQHKKHIFLLVGFLMIFSSVITINQFGAVSQTPTSSKLEQNGCPIEVKNGEVTVPIDFENITGVYKYNEYNVTYPWGQQTAHNYYTGQYNNGVVSNLNLTDGTQVVVEGNLKNQHQIQKEFCLNQPPPCDSYINLFNGEVNGSFPFDTIIGVYKKSEFNFSLGVQGTQTAINYYTSSSTYVNGKISGINLPDNTMLVIVGKQGDKTFFMDNFCQEGNNGPFTLGVHTGDVLEYKYDHNMTQAIPFFDFNNTLVKSGDTIKIEVLGVPSSPPTGPNKISQDSQFKVRFTVGSNAPLDVDHAMFFIQPKEFLEGSIKHDPNVPNELGNVTFFNDSIVIFTMADEKGQGEFTFDRAHGILIGLHGVLFTPDQTAIKVDIYQTAYIPKTGPDNGPKVTYGVHEGDSYELLFTTDNPNKIPIFNLTNNGVEQRIGNGEKIKVEIVSILVGLNKPGQEQKQESGMTIKLTIGANEPYETNETMFWVLPLEFIEGSIAGNVPNVPKATSYNDTHVMIEQNETQGFIKFTFDRKHGTLASLDGEFKDPQGNPIGLHLTIVGTNFVNDDDTSSSNGQNSLITAGGFEFIAFLPIVGIAFLIRTRKNNSS